MSEVGNWGLRGSSGSLLNSKSPENLRAAEVSLNGGAQLPAMGDLLPTELSKDVGDSSKGFHSVLALLLCGLSSAEDVCRCKVFHQLQYCKIESKKAQDFIGQIFDIPQKMHNNTEEMLQFVLL